MWANTEARRRQRVENGGPFQEPTAVPRTNDNPFGLLVVQQHIEAEKAKNAFWERENDMDRRYDYPDRMAAVSGWLNRSADFRDSHQSEHHYGATEAMTPDHAARMRQDNLPLGSCRFSS